MCLAKESKNALEYQEIKFSFDALVGGLVTKDALVMPRGSVSNDTSAHFSFKVTRSYAHGTKAAMSNLCDNCKKKKINGILSLWNFLTVVVPLVVMFRAHNVCHGCFKGHIFITFSDSSWEEFDLGNLRHSCQVFRISSLNDAVGRV